MHAGQGLICSIIVVPLSIMRRPCETDSNLDLGALENFAMGHNRCSSHRRGKKTEQSPQAIGRQPDMSIVAMDACSFTCLSRAGHQH